MKFTTLMKIFTEIKVDQCIDNVTEQWKKIEYMKIYDIDDIVTAQKQPQPQQQNYHNCSWVETR